MIVVDLNNLGVAATSGNKLHAGMFETQGIFGVLKRLHEIRSTYSGKMICLDDGYSFRYKFYPEYKANRRTTLVTNEELEETPINDIQTEIVSVKESWTLQKPYLLKMLRALGVTIMRADNLEADDLAARIVDKLPNEDHLLITGDRDWYQLISDRVVWFCPIQYQGKGVTSRVTLSNFEEVTGYKNTKKFVQSKALVGDAGDNIKGVGGIGSVAAKWILSNFETVEDFYLASVTEEAKLWPKKYRDFANDSDKFLLFCKNMALVDLRSEHAPPIQGLKIIQTKQNSEQFNDLCGELAFHSLLRRSEEILSTFKQEG